MTTEDWQSAWALFQSAIELSDSERDALLDSARSTSVREAVRGMIERATLLDSEREEVDGQPVLYIGPYRVTGTLGEGGMGTVYRAEQMYPLRRTVAIKVVRPGLRSKDVRERFEIERRALALMQHASIARVFDAGETAEGRPYFVMEYVSGPPIHRFCDSERLGIRQRIELLIQVCSAIQHAHQKGIIHRDIKSSNVLVPVEDGKPSPKVIDFGVARAIAPDSGASLMTQFGSVVGTLEYMSPEQAAAGAESVDTRTDVYALGVLAYELITGVTPLVASAGRHASLAAALESVRVHEPEPPGKWLKRGHAAEAAARMGISPEQLLRDAGHELDWIVMRALAKEPERRYQTANGLARDLERLLNGDPVEAGPPSTLYRARKLAAKHRVTIGVAAAFAAILVIATAVSVNQAVRASAAERAALADRERAFAAGRQAIADRERALGAERTAMEERDHALSAESSMRRQQRIAVSERDRADKEAASASAVARFLENDLLAMANPNTQTGFSRPDPDLRMRTVLDRASARLENNFKDQPELRASLEHTIGKAYNGLGLFREAAAHLERSLDVRRATLRPADPDTLAAMDAVAVAYRGSGQFARAEEMLRQTLKLKLASLGADSPEVLRTEHLIAIVLRSSGKYAESERLHEQVFEARRRVLGDEHADTMRSANDLGWVYLYTGKREKAEALLASNLDRRRKVLGAEHPDTLVTAHNLAMSRGNDSAIVAGLRPVLESQRKVIGSEHPDTLATLNNLGNALRRMGSLFEARDVYLEALAAEKAGNRASRFNVMNNLALVYSDLAEFEKSRELLEDAWEAEKKMFGPDHPDSTRASLNLTELALEQGRLHEASILAEPTYQHRLKRHGPAASLTMNALDMLVRVRLAEGRFSEAERMAAQLYEGRTSKAESESLALEAAGMRVVALTAMGRVSEAADLAASTLLLDGNLRPRLPSRAREAVAFLWWRQGRQQGAAELLQELVNDQRKHLPAQHPKAYRSAALLALLRLSMGQRAEAESLAREVLAAPKADGVTQWAAAVASGIVGLGLASDRKVDRAESALVESARELGRLWSSIPAIYRPEVASIWGRAAAAFRAAGDEVRATEWSTRAEAARSR